MELNFISIFFVLAASSCSDAFLLAPTHTTHSHAATTTTITSSSSNSSPLMQLQQLRLPSTMRTSTSMFYTHGHHGNVSSLPDTTDPFVLLNLHRPQTQHRASSSTIDIDIKEIKKAYRSMALIYHPDARIGTNATDEEKQKANDDFARINAAYAFLMNNKHKQKSSSSSSSSSSTGTGTGTSSKANTGHPNNTGRRGRGTESSQHQQTRTPRHTQSERMKKQQQQQHVQNQRRNDVENHARNSFYESMNCNRASTHRQRPVGEQVQGFDINGNPRTKSASTRASAQANSNTAKARASTASFFNNFNVQDNLGPTNTAPRTDTRTQFNGNGAPANARAKASTAKAKATSAFSKGDKVTIMGGAYGGRSGVVQNIYPTMVKVSISPSVDCFVDTKELSRCTESAPDSSGHGGFNENGPTGFNENGPTGTGTSFGFDADQYANPNVYDGHGYYNDLRGEYQQSGGPSDNSASASASGNSGGSAPNSNPYGNYVEDLKRGFNVNWKTVNAMHTNTSSNRSQTPDGTSSGSSNTSTSTGTGTGTGTTTSTFNSPDDTSSGSSGTSTTTSTSTFNTNCNSGSYSWRPSSGAARKKENIYLGRLNLNIS